MTAGGTLLAQATGLLDVDAVRNGHDVDFVYDVGVFSLILSDPYLVSNVLSGVLPLTAGVAAPLAAYPDWLRAISQLLPMSWTVDAMRTGGSPLPGELWTTVPWVVLGFAGVVLARRRLRDGRDASLF